MLFLFLNNLTHSFIYSLSLVALKQIKALASDPTHKKHFHLLELFAHGTYADYKQDSSKFPSNLNPAIIKKLKILSVVTMAASNKQLDYATLMDRLDMGDVRELEDLLIECIYAKLIVAKLDQQSSQLKVKRVSGRDPSDLDIANMCQKFDQLGNTVDNMLLQVDKQAKEATNDYNIEKLKRKELKDKIDDLKKKKRAAIMGLSSSKNNSGSGGWANVDSNGGGMNGDDDMAAAIEASRKEY
jgi:COP9 signalosome complex subunit 7